MMKKQLLFAMLGLAIAGMGNKTIAQDWSQNASSIKKTDAAITVDGVADEDVWGTAAENPIDRVFSGETAITGASDLSGYWKGVWNDDGIYLFVSVTDDIHYTDADFGQTWEKDKVEVYFDMNLDNLQDGAGAGGGYSADATTNNGHYQDAPDANDGDYAWKDASTVTILVDGTNYTYEEFFAWDDLIDADGNAIAPANGTVMGFDVYICDNDGPDGHGGVARQRLVWSNDNANTDASLVAGENWTSMDNAGLLTLSDAVGVHSAPEATISVYPNPANGGKLTLTNLNAANVNLYNAVGQCVVNQAVTSKVTTIDVSELPAGVYFVKAGDAAKKVVIR